VKNVKNKNNIATNQWLEYFKLLYECSNQQESPPTLIFRKELFTNKEVIQGLKKLVNGKALTIDNLQAKHIKWGPYILAP